MKGQEIKIPLTRPFLTEAIKERVCAVLESGFLTEGTVTRDFEEAFRQYLGCRHALAVTSCTSGLEMALRALGLGPGDEVIVPDFTYPATAHCIAVAGAEIVVVDVRRETMLIDYDKIEEAVTERTKAVIPVSMFGNPLDYDRLEAIREQFEIPIIEDAACSIGAEFKGVKGGNQADISVFSLHPRKLITTGEGGIIATDRSDWAEWMRSYKNFGRDFSSRELAAAFHQIGSNHKMSDLLAAVGLGQMQYLDALLEQRVRLSRNYLELLSGMNHLEIPATTKGGKHSRQSFCIYVENRNRVLEGLRERGIEAQIGTYSLHTQPAFADNGRCRIIGPMSGSRYAFEHCLTLPLYHELTYEQQKTVVSALEECL